MIEIEKPRIEDLDLAANGTYGKFVVEPLERGYGTTIGNSLRRVLLSSLPGVAVTSIKIDGILHEFSTIEGVKEDLVRVESKVDVLEQKPAKRWDGLVDKIIWAAAAWVLGYIVSQIGL